jgi:chromosome segregation ATPase
MKEPKNNEASEAAREVKASLNEVRTEIKTFQKKLKRVSRLVSKSKDKAKRQRKREQKQMSLLEQELKEKLEVASNEGEQTIEQVLEAVEPYAHLSQPQISGWEQIREDFGKCKELLAEYSQKCEQLESSIEDFEKKVETLTGGAIGREDLVKFRSDAVDVQVWMGRQMALLQRTAASGVVFLELINRNKEGLNN